MATYYVSAPGTTLGGAGTVGDPWTHIHYAMAQLRAGDTLKMNAGTYTAGMSWNSLTAYGGWHNGTGSSLITVEPVTYTADTTRGIPAGTSSAIWRVSGGGGALNMTPNVGYWSFRGIEFDATNQVRATALAYISLNNGTNNVEFRNCWMSKRSNTTNSLTQHIELANSGAGTGILNNAVRYCLTSGADAACSHDFYFRSSGNVVEYNDFTGSQQYGALQFFSSTGAGFAINDNIVRFNWFHDYPNTGSNQSPVLFSLNANRNLVYGNIITNNLGRRGIDLRGGSGVSGAADGNVIAYNTITGGAEGINIVSSGFTNTVVKNNIAYGNGASSAFNYIDSGTTTDALTNGFDGTNPVFTDSGADDYTLGGASPYLSGGTVLGSPFDDADYVGVVRDSNRSYGVYETDAGTTPVPPINVYPNPSGYTVNKNAATVLIGLSVTDSNSPSPLLTECWLSLADTNATWTAVDTSGGATSN